MEKRTLLAVVRLAALVTLILPGIPGRCVGQEIVVTNFGENAPVLFQHGKHADTFPCETCHHPEQSGGSHRCGHCHGMKAKGKVPRLQDAAHGEKIGKCWDCHFRDGARKKLDCEDCHRGKPR